MRRPGGIDGAAEARLAVPHPDQAVADRLADVFQRLLDSYGPQQWWPADNRLEIIVGAVLTQNTAWTNVERAIANLKQAGALNLDTLLALRQNKLADLLRPAGYFNIKAQRLSNLLNAIRGQGGVAGMAGLSTVDFRNRLLTVNGVGPETADDILLYAYGRPVFVVDAYTRRLFERLGLAFGNEGYETLRSLVESAVPDDVRWYQEFHALIVVHGKERCRPRPRCVTCPIEESCRYAVPSR